MVVAVLPLDAKARLMGAITNQVGKAWDTAFAAMWDIQENLLEVSTKAQALALPTLKTTKAKEDKATQEATPTTIYVKLV